MIPGVEFDEYRAIKVIKGNQIVVLKNRQVVAACIEITNPDWDLSVMACLNEIKGDLKQLRRSGGTDPGAVLTLLRELWRRGEKDGLKGYVGWYEGSSQALIHNIIGMFFMQIDNSVNNDSCRGLLHPFVWLLEDGHHGKEFLGFVKGDSPEWPQPKWMAESNQPNLYPRSCNIVTQKISLNLGIV